MNYLSRSLLFILLIISASVQNAQEAGDRFSSQKLIEEKKLKWKTAIDSIWGEGPSTEKKLEIFDTVWNAVNERFACFQNLNFNIDLFKKFYRAEIENGASQGRFAAILNHFAINLRETHTIFYNDEVNKLTVAVKDVPLIFCGGWGDNSRFGAALTPLPDSTLLVYQVVDNHPLGLERGDKIIGYEDIPWKILYRELLDAELPIAVNDSGHFRWGANETAFAHSWLMSAGLNWHLFNTIDLVKYSSEDTLHLPTDLLTNFNNDIYSTEQLPVNGVSFPNYRNNEYISWGIVDGTNIGYIYVWSWLKGRPFALFKNAVDVLMKLKTEGLIIDFRYNTGGIVSHADSGLSLLFNSEVENLILSKRSNPNNRFQLERWNEFNLSPNQSTYYDKPIAVLLGPGAFSAGDFVALRLMEHPHARVFGKTSSGSFASAWSFKLHDEGWNVDFAWLNGSIDSKPEEYLTRTELRTDSPVWLTPDDVRNNDDTMVKAAINWIKGNVVKVDEKSLPQKFILYQNYPNPFNPFTVIKYTLPSSVSVKLKVFDMLGREIITLVNEEQEAGSYEIKFDGSVLSQKGSSLTSGIYIYKLQANSFSVSKKMILLQ
jgi:hypothetical protein